MAHTLEHTGLAAGWPDKPPDRGGEEADTNEIHPVRVLEAKSPRSRSLAWLVPPGIVMESLFQPLSWLRWLPGHPWCSWLVNASPEPLSLSSHDVHSVPASVSKFPLL